ncbi:hypothetical protein EI545_15985 [Tabrizicola piscis]|uniref:Uncharacterized protein n=1 Tax=Tabrizicola piscis TaxID=2494374 RepID=A0A3S8U9Q5_9RHOB|nr:hypothetical protein [Tabrizicola piscis]AZL60195.1 hypothetical protein EI545_15985 [Tabrizicola piscis]
MPTKHIPIERRFARPSKDELADPYLQNELSRYFPSQATGWKELISKSRVVVLGEGKCGKTYEFQDQVGRLKEEGKQAFFFRLERLADADLMDTLAPDEERQLQLWLDSSDEQHAWFFLDAVDELKLRDGSLRVALRKIQRVIGNKTDRAHIFVSCRPADWNNQIDMSDISEMFPFEQDAKVTRAEEPEDLFVSVLKKDAPGDQKQEVKEETVSDGPEVYVLLPLAEDEISAFATKLDPLRASQFLEELAKNDAWALFQSPSDIIDGMALLGEVGHLGSLEEQVEAGIRIKLSENGVRARLTTLSLAKAREGAERLALALLMTKRRSLLVTKNTDEGNSLFVGDVLADWRPKEFAELLSRGLFDPSGVNAVRFHHRATQEYLAARRIEGLHSRGLPVRELLQLLFADTWGHGVVIPSMEPVAAWLSLWNQSVATELRKRKPDVLFRQGIPGSMPVSLRSTLLQDFVIAYKDSDWRGISIDANDVRRLAHGELASTVRDLWETAYKGHETRELLLELILYTPLNSCTDLAAQAAVDATIAEHHRVYAIRALLSGGGPEEKRLVSELLISKQLSARIVSAVLEEAYPDPLTLPEVVSIAKETSQTVNSVHGINYALYNLVQHRNLQTHEIREIREALVGILWEHRTAESRIYQAHSRYDHFVDAIFAGCSRDTNLEDLNAVKTWARDVAIAFHFGERHGSIIGERDCNSIRDRISSDPDLREAYYWAVFDLDRELKNGGGELDRFFLWDEGRVFGGVTASDTQWLLSSLENIEMAERHNAAFYAIMDWWRISRDPVVSARVQDAVKGRIELLAAFNAYLNPPVSEKRQNWQIKNEKRERKYKRGEEKRIAEWIAWRDTLNADPEAAFGPEKVQSTLFNFFNWLDMSGQSQNTWGVWIEHIVREAFSPRFVSLLKLELAKFWRQATPAMWSEKSPEARNQTSSQTIHALSAIKSEANDHQWARHIGAAEAALAARLSTVELNGFAPFYASLEAAYPVATQDAILAELNAQVRLLGQHDQCPIIHDIYYHGTLSLKTAASTGLIPLLETWPIDMSGEAQTALRYAVDMISQHVHDADRKIVADVVASRLTASVRFTSDHVSWLRALFMLDPSSGADQWIATTNDLSSPEARDFAVTTIGSLFGDRHHGGSKPDLSDLAIPERARLLARLLHRTYQVAHPSTDIPHHGVHSPGERDLAEEARRFLFESLVSLESPEVDECLRKLSELEAFSHMKDRLQQIRVEQAAKYSERPAMTVNQFTHFDAQINLLPTDTRTMHLAMMNRLEDFRHHILESEFSNRRTLQAVTSEIEMRRNISGWLNTHSRGAYHVNQEAVKKDEKRTDIRLTSVAADIEATIELKLEDTGRWTFPALEQALRVQLVGQYLSHQRCQAGCLLLVLRKHHQWRDPVSSLLLDLNQVVARLQDIAQEIMRQRPELQLSVFGIDISA